MFLIERMKFNPNKDGDIKYLRRIFKGIGLLLLLVLFVVTFPIWLPLYGLYKLGKSYEDSNKDTPKVPEGVGYFTPMDLAPDENPRQSYGFYNAKPIEDSKK